MNELILHCGIVPPLKETAIAHILKAIIFFILDYFTQFFFTIQPV